MSLLQSMYEAISPEERKMYTDFTKEVKQWLKKHYPEFTWRVSTSGSARPNPFIEITHSDWRTKPIPNDLRKLAINKGLPDAKVLNWDDISYGNISANGITLHYSEWLKVLGRDMSLFSDMYNNGVAVLERSAVNVDWGIAGATLRGIPAGVAPDAISYGVNWETQDNAILSKLNDARVNCVPKGDRIEMRFTMEVYKILKAKGDRAKQIMKAYKEITDKVLKELAEENVNESKVADFEIDALDALRGMVSHTSGANIDSLKDILSSKFKSSFGGNLEKAKRWANQFVADHFNTSTGKIVECVNEEMAYLEPSRKHYAGIVDKMRDYLDVTGIPKWFRFLIFQSGTSNKFHYFAVFQNGKTAVSANAFGRIGYTPQVNKIAEGDYDDVESVTLSKYKAKVSKGYVDVTEELKK